MKSRLKVGCVNARLFLKRTTFKSLVHKYRPCFFCQKDNHPDFQKMIKDSTSKKLEMIIVLGNGILA